MTLYSRGGVLDSQRELLLDAWGPDHWKVLKAHLDTSLPQHPWHGRISLGT